MFENYQLHPQLFLFFVLTGFARYFIDSNDYSQLLLDIFVLITQDSSEQVNHNDAVMVRLGLYLQSLLVSTVKFCQRQWNTFRQ